MNAANRWSRFAVLFALACATALTGCGKKDEPSKEAPKADGRPQPAEPKDDRSTTVPSTVVPPKLTESLATMKPDVVVTAKELIEEASKDPFVLATKYAGKVVEVSGRVDDLSGKPGSTYLVLRGGEKYGESPFRCDVTEKNIAAKILPSQIAVLRIRGPKSPEGLRAAAWEIVEAKGGLPALTAEQFVREWATSEENKFREKYHQQHVILTGVISKVESDDDGTRVFLISGKESQIDCWFPGGSYQRVPFSQKQKESLKPGQVVKVCGEFSSVAGRLVQCILLEPAP